MDFRRTYGGEGRYSNGRHTDPFAQLQQDRDVRQQRDDMRSQTSGAPSSKGAGRPTQASLAKNSQPTERRGSYSSRTSGRYGGPSFATQSVDLTNVLSTPAYRGGGGSRIPRQSGQMPPPPPPSQQQAGASTAEADKIAHAVRDAQMRVIAEGTRREATLKVQILEAERRCNDLAYNLQQARLGWSTEIEASTKLRADHERVVQELAQIKSQATELQVSGNVAQATSEVCRKAMTTALAGTLHAMGDAQELSGKLGAAVADKESLERELEACRERIASLLEAVQQKDKELGDGRAQMHSTSVSLEQLADKLCNTEDQLSAIVRTLVPEMPGTAGDGSAASDEAYGKALAEADYLKNRIASLEVDSRAQNQEADAMRARITEYENLLQRLKESLQVGSGTPASLEGERDLVEEVSEMALGREQLEGDNLQLAAHCEELQRMKEDLEKQLHDLRNQNEAMWDQMQDTLLSAAIASAQADRGSRSDITAAAESLAQEVQELRAKIVAYEQQAVERNGRSEETEQQLVAEHEALQDARRRAEKAEGLLAAANEEGQTLRRRLQDAEESIAAGQEKARELQRKAEAADEMLTASRAEARDLKRRLEEAERQQEAVVARCEELETEAGKRKEEELQAALEETRLALAQQQAANRTSERQLISMRGEVEALLQRIRSAEAERQQLLLQISDSNSKMTALEKKLEDATGQAAEAATLRVNMDRLQQETGHHASAASASAARVVLLNAELEGMRSVLQSSRDRASQEARSLERREQQVQQLQEQLRASEAKERAGDAEMNLLRMQAGENNKLRAQVGELQGQLALACAPKPRCDAYTHMEGPQLAAMASGLYMAGPSSGSTLMEVYGSIPEDEDDFEMERPRRASSRPRRFRPLGFLLGMTVKATLLAGGMAAGLALGNPEAFQLGGVRRRGRGGAGGGEPGLVVVEGMALPPLALVSSQAAEASTERIRALMTGPEARLA